MCPWNENGNLPGWKNELLVELRRVDEGLETVSRDQWGRDEFAVPIPWFRVVKQAFWSHLRSWSRSRLMVGKKC